MTTKKSGRGSHPLPASLQPVRVGGSLRADSTHQCSAVLTEERKRRVKHKCAQYVQKRAKKVCKVENIAVLTAASLNNQDRMTFFQTQLIKISIHLHQMPITG